jgi:phosphate/sulfate permease
MSRTAIAIFGLMAVAGINTLGPAVAQRISQVVTHERHDRGMETDLRLSADVQPADRAGWDSHTLLDGR